MGQQNESLSAHPLQSRQLQVVSPEQGLYLNHRNNKLYIRNNVIIGNIGDIQYQKDIYMFRRINDQYLVSVDYYHSDSEQQMCTSYSSLIYFVEKQEYTLFQKCQISLQEGLKLLINVIKGFDILYEKFGYFTPSAKLVFFNQQHQPKVWINEDIKITKNVQHSNCPKAIALQNTMIRQIIHFFDALRDPINPNIRYSQYLPQCYLTFKLTESIYSNIIPPQSIHPFRKGHQKAFSQLHNVNVHHHHYHLPQKGNNINQPTMSLQLSPMNSPRHCDKDQQPTFRQNNMNFVYTSPQKQKEVSKINDLRESVKVSLKNASGNINTIKPTNNEIYKEFGSTVPTSLKNSGIMDFIEKRKCFEKPFTQLVKRSSKNMLKINENYGKKPNFQRNSQFQSTSFGKEVEQNLIGPKSIQAPSVIRYSQQSSSINIPFRLQRERDRKQNSNIHTNQSNDSCHKMKFVSSIEEQPVRRDFQCHKRHQTDAQLIKRLSVGKDSRLDRLSNTSGNFLQKFNLNTIKSIHLQDVDKQFDTEIIMDLKNIINKYKGSKL